MLHENSKSIQIHLSKNNCRLSTEADQKLNERFPPKSVYLLLMRF